MCTCILSAVYNTILLFLKGFSLYCLYFCPYIDTSADKCAANILCLMTIEKKCLAFRLHGQNSNSNLLISLTAKSYSCKHFI